MKRFIKYSLYTIGILILFLFVFLYLVTLGENRISIMIHQGLTSLPSNLNNISIEKRRGLYSIFTNYDDHATSKCTVSKKNLDNWLKSSAFQVIYYRPINSTEPLYYTSYDSLPKSIFNNENGFAIHLEANNPKKINVDFKDENNLNLTFESDWN